MRKITVLSLTGLTTLTALYAFPVPANASFGDVLLGAGAAIGAKAIIDSNNNDERRPASPEQEYYRGVQDGTNGAKYDNPRASADYDRGYEEGLREERGS